MFSSFFLFSIYLLKYTAFLLSYVSNTNAFPKPLSPKEEEKYVKLAISGDNDAKNILIERNLRLVAHVAKKYTAANEKEAEDLNRHFLQRRHIDGQEAHEKMFNIANY